jgi:hypothetical protein
MFAVLLRRVRELLRARADEDHDRREMAVDAHDRLYHRGRGGGLCALLSPRVLRQPGSSRTTSCRCHDGASSSPRSASRSCSPR